MVDSVATDNTDVIKPAIPRANAMTYNTNHINRLSATCYLALNLANAQNHLKEIKSMSEVSCFYNNRMCSTISETLFSVRCPNEDRTEQIGDDVGDRVNDR